MAPLPNSVVSLFAPVQTVKPQPKVLSVSELVFDVRKNIETVYREVQVVGEISSFKPWRSGHWYFDLKDEHALLPAVMFKPACGRVKFDVQDGMQVLVTGRVSLYAAQSKVQIVVENMEPVGVGALALAFEQLKKKLEQDGLFAEVHKKKLPLFPRVVGLVTSPQGAVLRDMLRILRQRMPKVQILIAPCRVQGPGASTEISDALRRLDDSGDCDVIIVGRGGGSLEDLWAFNEEIVARTIYACKTTIVSAVGHETDFTIADFVADLRCATPTHAAQAVVSDINEVITNLSLRESRLHRQMKMLISKHFLCLGKIAKKIQDPRLLMMRRAQHVDDLSMRSYKALTQLIVKQKSLLKGLNARFEAMAPQAQVGKKRRRFDELSQRLQRCNPSLKLEKAQRDLLDVRQRMSAVVIQQWQKHKQQTRLYAARLLALSPLHVLSRGYALVCHSTTEKESRVVSAVADVGIDDALSIRMSDGFIEVRVESVKIIDQKESI